MKTMAHEFAVATPSYTWLKAGTASGIAGGLAEVIFMAAYNLIVGKSGLTILSLITLTFFDREIAFGSIGAFSGLLIHFALSIIVGIFFSIFMFSDKIPISRVFGSGIALLVAIWSFNFFLLLPDINPEFVETVPVNIALFSKLLFGVSMGIYLKLIATPKVEGKKGR